MRGEQSDVGSERLSINNKSWKTHGDRVGHRGNGPVDLYRRVLNLHVNSEEARLNFNGAGLAQRRSSVEVVVAS